MYDYNNGRFLSVDPFIQNPTSTQSLNPYTYIFNNPLSGTDPSGYFGEDTRCGSDDYACQWDQSMASVLGVSRDAITEMYNGIREQQQNSKSDKSDNSEKESQNGGGIWNRFVSWWGSDGPGPMGEISGAAPSVLEETILEIEASNLSRNMKDIYIYRAKKALGSVSTLPLSTKGDYVALALEAIGLKIGFKFGKGKGSKVPLGFKEGKQFDDAMSQFKNAIDVDDALIGVRGSSTTGVKHTGGAFDEASDIDFFVVSDKLYQQGLKQGAHNKDGALSVAATKLFFPKLHSAEKAVGNMTGRKSSIRIYSKKGYETVKASTDIY